MVIVVLEYIEYASIFSNAPTPCMLVQMIVLVITENMHIKLKYTLTQMVSLLNGSRHLFSRHALPHVRVRIYYYIATTCYLPFV